MNTVLMATALVAFVSSAEARPIGRSPYAPPAKPDPYYAPPVTARVPDAGSAAALLGIAAAALAIGQRKWKTSI